MTQGAAFEQLSGGPLQLVAGGKTFEVSQRGIFLGKSDLGSVGVIKKDIVLPNGFYEGAKGVNAILNKVSVEEDANPSVNAFWINSEQLSSDFVFVKFPINVGSDQSHILTCLKMSSGSGKEFIEALRVTQDGSKMQELLGTVLQLNEAQHINTKSIAALNLVVFNGSANEVARNYLKPGADIKALYAQNRDKMLVQKILSTQSEGSELISSPSQPKAVVLEPVVESASLQNESVQADNFIEVRTQDEEQLLAIDSTIQNRLLFDKFWSVPNGLSVHGQQFLPSNYSKVGRLDDWMTVGVNGEIKMGEILPKDLEPTGKLTYFYLHIFDSHVFKGVRMEDFVPKEFDFHESLNIVHAQDPRSPDTTNIFILVPSSRVDTTDRDCSFAGMFCSMPTDQFKNLEGLIDKSPDNAERIIEITFQGADQLMKRISVPKVAIVDADRYLPTQLDYDPYVIDYSKVRSRKLIATRSYNVDGVKVRSYEHGPLPLRK